MELALGIALLYILIIVELVIIRMVLKEPLPWKELVTNLNSGHILMWVGRGFEVVSYGYFFTHFSLHIVSHWPYLLQWIFAFVCWDFCFYWLHRLHHTVPFLWNIHVVHHQGEHFSLSLGIRNSWYSSLTSLPFFIPMAIIGVSVEQFLVVGSIHYFIQFYNHNRIVKRSGWLEYLMVTPAYHKVHHGRNPEYRDKNCAGAFIIWDKLFGTFQRELDHVPIEYGVDDPVKSENPFWINNKSFLSYFGIRTPRFKRRKSQTNLIPDSLIGLGGLILFGWLVYYISVETIWNYSKLSILFSLIFLSTISIAGLAEGKLWGFMGWTLFSIIGNAVFVFYYTVPSVIYFLFLLNVLHLIVLMTQFLKQLKKKMKPLIFNIH